MRRDLFIVFVRCAISCKAIINSIVLASQWETQNIHPASRQENIWSTDIADGRGETIFRGRRPGGNS